MCNEVKCCLYRRTVRKPRRGPRRRIGPEEQCREAARFLQEITRFRYLAGSQARQLRPSPTSLRLHGTSQRKQKALQLEDTLVSRLVDTVHACDMGVQARSPIRDAIVNFHAINWDRSSNFLKRAGDLLHDTFGRNIGAVEVDSKVVQTNVFESALDYFERGAFLSHEQDPFTCGRKRISGPAPPAPKLINSLTAPAAC